MIKTKHVWQEIVKPEEIEKSEDNKFIWVAIYKALYMSIRILLDIRHVILNSSQKSNKKYENKSKEFTNPVIKPTDNIQIKGKTDETKTK